MGFFLETGTFGGRGHLEARTFGGEDIWRQEHFEAWTFGEGIFGGEDIWRRGHFEAGKY